MLSIKIKSGGRTAYISVQSNDPNKSSKVSYEGDQYILSEAFYLLKNAYGAFGHTLDPENANPIDLHSAVMRELQRFRPEVVKGQELIKRYNNKLPFGAIS